MQNTGTKSITLAATSTKIFEAQMKPIRRMQFQIVNTDASATVWVLKGPGTAAVNVGTPLAPNGGFMIESSDSGFQCWQGEIQAISTGATNISISEMTEDGRQ